MPCPFRIAAAVGGLAVVLGACSADEPSAVEPAPPSVADPAPATTAAAEPPDVTVRGPIDGTPQTSSTAGMAEHGYVEEEYLVSGEATAFEPVGELASDGRWTVTPADVAPYTTRILVKRPVDPASASGVVFVEWNNVSAGFDSTPDWTYGSAELLRSGHVHVAVSAQEAGVDGEGGGLLGGFGSPLTVADPDRYGELDHPGDQFSYDLFAQMGALARRAPPGGADPLADLPRRHVVAIGESQSAFRLTSFINGIHRREPVFDGFLVHSRGGGAAPFLAGGSPTDALSGGIHIRDDLEAPVLVFTTETDLTVLGYAAARQPDRGSVRSWEVAGTAHADAFVLGGDPVVAADILGCEAPVNDGPQHLALKAALSHLTRWVVDGSEPPDGEEIELDDTGAIVRDQDGIARGGIRLPAVEVPAATLSGAPQGGGVVCGLFGSTTPLSPEELSARYGSGDAYLDLADAAVDSAVDDGFLLEADDAPHPPPADPTQRLQPVVAVLEHELAVAVRDDHGRRLQPVLDAAGQVVHVGAPVVLVHLLEHRVPGRSGQPVELVGGELHRAQPPPGRIRQVCGEGSVVAARAGEEVGHPRAEVVARCRLPGRIDRVRLIGLASVVVRGFGHGWPYPPSAGRVPRAGPGVSPAAGRGGGRPR